MALCRVSFVPLGAVSVTHRALHTESSLSITQVAFLASSGDIILT